MQPEALEAIARPGRRRPIYEPIAAHAVDLGRTSIERLLEHRDPFLFVDRVTAVDLARPAIACLRRIDPADPVFRGHFPENPVYPGVLLLETMGQAGLVLLGLLKNGRTTVGPSDVPRPIRGLKIHHTVFLAEVHPGDELVSVATVLEEDAYTATCAGQVLRGGAGDTVCCFGVMEVYFVEA